MKHIASLALALLALPTTGWSAPTACVNPGGTGGCFATIQAAVDSTPGTLVIDIAAGTYAENVRVVGRKTLRGAGSGVTTLSAPSVPGCPAALCLGGPRTTVSGMTITGVRVEGVAGNRATLSDVVLSGSSSAGLVVEERGRADVVRATISGNPDGGVQVLLSTATITDSTISDNDGFAGGGLYGYDSQVKVAGSTISGNGAVRCGGVTNEGRFNRRGKMTIERSTIAGNTATASAGGGICNDGILTLRASVVADNTAAGGAPDCATFTSRPGNRLVVNATSLIEDTAGCAAVVAGSAALLTGDPALGPLQDNGGPTFTQALLAGSPAIGVLTRPASCRRPDQRGVVRAVPCDLGAYEAP